MCVLKIIIISVLIFNFTLTGSVDAKEVENIGVFDFNNDSDSSELDHFKSELSNALINKLNKYSDLKVIDRSKLNSALKEINSSNDDYTTPVNAVKSGKALGLNYVVLGSLDKSGDSYSVGIRLFDMKSSKMFMRKEIESKNKEGVIKSINYLSLIVANNLGINVDKKDFNDSIREMETYKPNTILETTALVILTTEVVCFVIIEYVFPRLISF